MYTYNCIIERIIDGDTVDVSIDLGFDAWLHNQRVRLSDIDAPEVRTRDLVEKADGEAATRYLAGLLPVGSQQKLISKKYQRGKYGRIIGTFEVYDHSRDAWSDASTIMLEQGHADRYQ